MPRFHKRRVTLLLVAVVLWTVPAVGMAQRSPAIGDPAGENDTAATQKPPEPAKAIPLENLWTIVQAGGKLMIPIGVCSFILVVFVLERAVTLRRGRVIPRPFVKRFMKQLREGELDREKALELCYDNGSPVAEVFLGAVRKWGRPAVEVEQAIIDSGERVTNELRRYLRVINGVATISPLLGLLGTVVGMIRAFNDIARYDGLGRPEKLAEGISEALLTTAGGLTVAIPALIFYLFFISRVDRLVIDIDAMGQDVVNVIAAEEIAAKQAKKKEPRTTKTRGGNKEEA